MTLTVTAFAVIGSFIGAAISTKVHPDRLRKGFGYFVLAMAVFILSQEIGQSIIDFAQGSTIQLIEVIVGAAIIVVGVVVLIRWPAKVPVGDFDLSGAEGTESENVSNRAP